MINRLIFLFFICTPFCVYSQNSIEREQHIANIGLQRLGNILFDSSPRLTTPIPKTKKIESDEVDAGKGKPNTDFLTAIIRNPKEIGEPKTTPLDGLYQIVIENEVYYLSQDGRYLIEGNLLDLASHANLTEQKRNEIRTELLNQIPNDDFIIFPTQRRPPNRITVFIDLDCPYCRVIYENIGRYSELGIEIRFAAFPRAGLNSIDYEQMVSIWCTLDKKATLARVYQGMDVVSNNCQAPIETEYLTALRLGVNTVPSYVLEDGSLIAGYISPENLSRILRVRKKQK